MTPNHNSLILKILKQLKSVFKHDTVDISTDIFYKGPALCIIVVSRKFIGKSEYERFGMIQKIMSAVITKTEKSKIGRIIAKSPDELY